MQYIIDDIDNYNSDFYLTYFKKYGLIINDKIKNSYRLKQSILVRYFLEKLLNNKINIVDNFIYNKYGKPFFKDNICYFNFSHSKNKCITVISNKEIGVDIEEIKKIDINVINKFATENEKKYITESNDEVYKRLFIIYVLKEAYCKMLGKDLNKMLEVEFMHINNELKCSDKSVNIKYFVKDNYTIGICEKS